MSLSLYPVTFQERDFNDCVKLSRISYDKQAFLKKSILFYNQFQRFKKENFNNDFLTLLSHPVISVWVAIVDTLWKLLLREAVHWDKFYLVDTASSFCLLLIPGSFKKNLCPLINTCDKKTTLVYIIFFSSWKMSVIFLDLSLNA